MDRKCKPFLLAALLLLPGYLFGFLENYNNYQYLFGDRAAGMGGTFCAIGNDSTALWYNPAGLANIQDEKLNISANSYSYLTRNTEQYWQIESTAGSYDGLDLKESDLSIVPTSVTYARRINLLGNDVLGFGVFVPTQDSIDASIIGHTEGILNVDLHATYRMNTKAYYGLLGYGIQLAPGLNLGVSANMVFLQTSGGANISAYLDPGGTYQSEIVMIIKNDLKALAFSFGMGLQFSPWEGHWIGAYFRTPAYRSYATVEETQISQQVGPIFPDGNQSQTLTTSSSYRYRIRPALCSLGYGYTRKNAWAWSLEGTLHFTDEDSPNRVINVRTGIELYLLRNVILRGGFFTDYSQKDTVTQSSSNDEKNDFYGTSLSLSIGNELNPLRDENIRAKSMWTTVGILYQYGIGDIRGFRFYTVTPSNEMPMSRPPTFI